jgi:hypothetical protein
MPKWDLKLLTRNTRSCGILKTTIEPGSKTAGGSGCRLRRRTHQVHQQQEYTIISLHCHPASIVDRVQVHATGREEICWQCCCAP